MNAPAHEYGRWGDTDAPATIVPIASTVADVQGARGRHILMGWCLQNNGGAAGGVNLWDGEDVNGRLAFVIPLAAQAVTMFWIGDRGVYFETGVFIDLTTATIRGALFLVPLGGRGERPPRAR